MNKIHKLNEWMLNSLQRQLQFAHCTSANKLDGISKSGARLPVDPHDDVPRLNGRVAQRGGVGLSGGEVFEAQYLRLAVLGLAEVQPDARLALHHRGHHASASTSRHDWRCGGCGGVGTAGSAFRLVGGDWHRRPPTAVTSGAAGARLLIRRLSGADGPAGGRDRRSGADTTTDIATVVTAVVAAAVGSVGGV